MSSPNARSSRRSNFAAPGRAYPLVAVLALAAAIVVAIPVRPARAAAGATADRDGLLLEYRFEGQLEDASGGNHRGKLAGTPVFAAGREGQCLSLDGTGAFVDSGTNLPSLKDTFTIECWVDRKSVV